MNARDIIEGMIQAEKYNWYFRLDYGEIKMWLHEGSFPEFDFVNDLLGDYNWRWFESEGYWIYNPDPAGS